MNIYANNHEGVAQGKAQPAYSFLSPFFDKAFRILRRNYAAPGEDGISIKMLRRSYKEYKARLEHYTSTPPKPKTIIDYNGKLRTLYKYNIQDIWLQTSMRLYIEKKTCYRPHHNVFSYRKKSGEYLIKNYIDSWETKTILCIDIKNFYKNISWGILFKKLGQHLTTEELSLLRNLAQPSNSKGLIVGNSLSIFLANYYLDTIDKMFDSGYARYGDDMFFNLSQYSKEDLLLTLNTLLKKLNLSLNNDKIRIIRKDKICKI